jgi:hypothetical protein
MESKALSIEVHSTAFLQQSESNTSLADKRSPHFAYRFTKDAARSSRDSNPSLITRACTPLTTSKFPNSTAAAVRLTSTTESLLRSVFRIRGGVEGVVVEEGLLEAGHAAEGGERAGEAVPWRMSPLSATRLEKEAGNSPARPSCLRSRLSTRPDWSQETCGHEQASASSGQRSTSALVRDLRRSCSTAWWTDAAWTGVREAAGTVRGGQGHFGQLISVKLGPVLYDYSESYYNVIP